MRGRGLVEGRQRRIRRERHVAESAIPESTVHAYLT